MKYLTWRFTMVTLISVCALISVIFYSHRFYERHHSVNVVTFACNEPGFPLGLTVKNDSDLQVLLVSIYLTVGEPDCSSSLRVHIADDKILNPHTQHSLCWSIPTVSPTTGLPANKDWWALLDKTFVTFE